MRKETEPWTIRDLRDKYKQINFPEYQREPNVWGRDAKQRLVDSIVRRFDIASFYFYVDEDGSLDCVDGRQRIGAIMSFLDENPGDEHNSFDFRVLNEIYSEESNPNEVLNRKNWREIEKLAGDDDSEIKGKAEEFVGGVLGYTLTVVKLHESAAPQEFNLQFARLNLGTIINSGEKLNAMMGRLRNICFDELGDHEFLRSAAIPTRRFAREQLAAQILAQVFAIEEGRRTGVRGFARTRHNDLQRLFKDNTRLTEDQNIIVERVRRTMDLLAQQIRAFPALRSRAIVLSAFLLAYQKGVESDHEAQVLARFVSEFVRCLRWQIRKGLDVDPEYRYLVDFQRHLTQASVEKPAVASRAAVLERAYDCWVRTNKLPGDEEYETENPGSDAAALRAV